MSWKSRPAALSVLVVAAALASPVVSWADDYPTKPIRLVVPFPAGGSGDIQARLIAKELAVRLGKPVVIENRGGAGGIIGAATVARAEPDGYTLLFGGFSVLVVEPVIRKDLPYSIKRDFTPITVATVSPRVLVASPEFPGSSVRDLIATARKSPGALTYASVGPGSTAHLYLEAFKVSAGIDVVHVPYKGEAPALIDIIGGRVTMMLTSITSALPHIRAGKLKPLAVTGQARSGSLPDTPTFRESGISAMDAEAWWGFLAPSKTPRDIVARLNSELFKALQSSSLMEALDKQGVTAAPSTPERMSAMIEEDHEFIAKLVRSIQFSVE